MANKIIIADAGPLIAFGKIREIHLLTKTLGTVIVPDAVLGECLANPARAGAKEISEAINKKLIKPHKNPEHNKITTLFSILGTGEASAIMLGIQLKAGILMDEKLGRRAAQKMNIPVIGTAGVLLLAKEKNIIDKIEPLISELKKSGYYLSEELIKTVLCRAKEIKEPLKSNGSN